ncbi:hypothetical protein SE17_33270 [Kouleothrix aurantiaca]|uniref:Uncharacterized protein n=1 Tax=Kouleothrix aurantiaca TaxID=186479 RepID=A0A0P9D9X1_9CHLR|nr:hypothetical protein SE17_33270 [Kouleothrix aurantiaca]
MDMIDLAHPPADWRATVAALRASGKTVLLTLDGALCGMLIPQAAPQPAPAAPEPARPAPALHTYLELLRDDATLVPLRNGQPLEFVTMMNSSYIDPQQLYQFRDPRTGEAFIYRAMELQQAIGRVFASVDFIPQRPKDFVSGKS